MCTLCPLATWSLVLCPDRENCQWPGPGPTNPGTFNVCQSLQKRAAVAEGHGNQGQTKQSTQGTARHIIFKTLATSAKPFVWSVSWVWLGLALVITASEEIENGQSFHLFHLLPPLAAHPGCPLPCRVRFCHWLGLGCTMHIPDRGTWTDSIHVPARCWLELREQNGFLHLNEPAGVASACWVPMPHVKP